MKDGVTVLERKILETALKYDITCRSYEELYKEEQFEKYERILPKIEKILEGKILVDYGSGPLLFFEFLKNYGYDKKISYYIGVDISHCLLKLGANKFFNEANIDVVLGDILYLPIRGRSVDIFVSITVIGNLLDEWRKGINNMVNTCKNMGVVTVLRINENMNIISEMELDNKSIDLGKDISFIIDCEKKTTPNE